MPKKLTAELDVDTSKAKRKVKEVVDTGGGSAAGGDSVAPAAEKAAQELGKAARNTRDFGEKAQEASAKVSNMSKMLTGLGVGLAQSIMTNGSMSGGWFGKASAGAVSAAAMGYQAGGKKGAAAAALASFGVTYFEEQNKDLDKQIERANETSANIESIKAWEEARKRTLEFKETLEALTNVEDSLIDRQQRLAEEIRTREEADRDLARQLVGAASGEAKDFQRLQARRQVNASEIDTLTSLGKQLAKEKSTESRPSYEALDALSRVGGAFGGSGGGALQTIAQTSSEQLRVLKSIDAKTHPGDSTWQ